MGLLPISNFLAILALAAGAASLAVLILRLAAPRSESAAGWLAGIRDAIGPYHLWLAWLVAATATAGSFYFGTLGGLTPCTWCWYQRIAMYPLVVILLIAAARSDERIRPYATALAGIGVVLSAYHTLLQRLPGLPSGTCSVDASCTAIDLERFGFVTIPVMALIAFATILVLVWVVTPTTDEERTDDLATDEMEETP